MTYKEYVHRTNVWNDVYDRLLNRVGVVNQIHGCVYGWGVGNPLSIDCRLGVYSCRYFGEVLCMFNSKSVAAVEHAYAVVDGLANALWLVRRAGKLRA